MSYILEALKKLEKERRRERIPGLSEQDSVVYHSERRPVWPYLLIAVFSLNAALLIWWFLPNAKDKAIPAAPSRPLLAAPAVTQAVKSPELAGPVNSISSGAAESTSVSLPPVSPPATDSASRNTVQSVRNIRREDAQKTAKLVNSESKAENEELKMTEASPQEKKPDVLADPLPEKKLYKLSELPPSVRESLQKFFTITAYMYSSSPSERKVRINDHMMQEGQELEPGIRIEEIVPDGVILSYKKFRFFVSLK